MGFANRESSCDLTFSWQSRASLMTTMPRNKECTRIYSIKRSAWRSAQTEIRRAIPRRLDVSWTTRVVCHDATPLVPSAQGWNQADRMLVRRPYAMSASQQSPAAGASPVRWNAPLGSDEYRYLLCLCFPVTAFIRSYHHGLTMTSPIGPRNKISKRFRTSRPRMRSLPTKSAWSRHG